MPETDETIMPLETEAPAICLIGPTAVGKTALSLRIAEQFACEIISVDSMQVYRYMDIGTAKATRGEREQVPHHLIDIVDPDAEYHVARYMADAKQTIAGIRSRGKLPLLVGGTGLYLKGLLQGLFDGAEIDHELRAGLARRLAEQGHDCLHAELRRCDPESARRIHPNDSQRLLRALEIYLATGVPWSGYLREQEQKPLLRNVLKLGLTCDRNMLYQRINARVRLMVDQGLLNEVQMLLEKGYSGDLKSMQAIGYRHMVRYLRGEWTWERALELLARDTRRYAKRQFTWFGKEPGLNWFQPSQTRQVVRTIGQYLASQGKRT